MVARLQDQFRKQVVPSMMKDFGFKNVHQVPRLDKVVVSMGVKEGTTDIKILDQAAAELATITGQKPLVTRAKKSISNFKVRQGQPIGLKVTLRRARMYEFIDRLFNVAMPRVRDFRGLDPSSFDGQANFNFGLQEQIIFPEIEFDKVKKVQGMNITLVTTSRNKEHSRRLLEYLGLPLRK